MSAPTKTPLANRTGGLLVALAVLVTLVGRTSVHASPGPVSLSIVNRKTGEVLRTWRRSGRLYVAGETGARYAIHAVNHSDGRVLVILSVDGVNVVNGETASYDSNGYVLAPYGVVDVTGWRKSNAEVAAFTFASQSQSYAALTGRPADVGVVGMAVFTERPAPPSQIIAEPVAPSFPRYAKASADRAGSPATSAYGSTPLSVPPPPPPPPPPPAAAPAPPPPISASARVRAAPADAAPLAYAQADERLGTAHGAREWSYVSYTSFERATISPVSVVQIEYDTPAHLIARGVIPRNFDAPGPGPSAFPAAPGGLGFVPDPPGAR